MSEERTITVSVCDDCGSRSVPYLGHYRACRADPTGSHRRAALVLVDVDDDEVARDFAAALREVRWFDRERALRAHPELAARGEALLGAW